MTKAKCVWRITNYQGLVFLLLIISKVLGLYLGGWLTLIGLLVTSVIFCDWLTKMSGGSHWQWQNWLVLLINCLIWLPLGLIGLTSTLQAGLTMSAPLQNYFFQTRYVWLPVAAVIDIGLMFVSVKWLPAFRTSLAGDFSWKRFWYQGWRQSGWKIWLKLIRSVVSIIGQWLLGIGVFLTVQFLIEPWLIRPIKALVATILLAVIITWSWQKFIRLLQIGLGTKRRHQSWWFSGILAIVLAISWLLPYTVAKPFVIAHRGVDANDGVQNTTQALRRTVQTVKPDYVEIDIQQTADKHFIVLHDENLRHLARRRIQVGQLPLKNLVGLPITEHGKQARLSAFSNYQRLATDLKQPLIVEIKVAHRDSRDMVAIFAKHYQSTLMHHQSVVHSLDYSVVTRLKRVAPKLKVGYITPFNLVSLANNAADFYSLQSITLSREQILAARRQQKLVAVWTVDQPWSTVHCWGLGANGLITDRATQTKNILRQQKPHYYFWQMVNWVTQLF